MLTEVDSRHHNVENYEYSASNAYSFDQRTDALVLDKQLVDCHRVHDTAAFGVARRKAEGAVTASQQDDSIIFKKWSLFFHYSSQVVSVHEAQDHDEYRPHHRVFAWREE